MYLGNNIIIYYISRKKAGMFDKTDAPDGGDVDGDVEGGGVVITTGMSGAMEGVGSFDQVTNYIQNRK